MSLAAGQQILTLLYGTSLTDLHLLAAPIAPCLSLASANWARSPPNAVTLSGIEPGLEDRKNHKRHADLHSALRVLPSSRWGHLGAVEIRTDLYEFVQMGP